jgi:hypothetical protein
MGPIGVRRRQLPAATPASDLQTLPASGVIPSPVNTEIQAAGVVVVVDVVVDVEAVVVVMEAGAVVVVDVEAVVVVVSLTPVWGIGPSSSSPQAPSASTATSAEPRTAQRLPRCFSTALEHG